MCSEEQKFCSNLDEPGTVEVIKKEKVTVFDAVISRTRQAHVCPEYRSPAGETKLTEFSASQRPHSQMPSGTVCVRTGRIGRFAVIPVYGFLRAYTLRLLSGL